jgi:hypothetical protein
MKICILYDFQSLPKYSNKDEALEILTDIYPNFVEDNYTCFKSHILSILHLEYAEKYESAFHYFIHNYAAFKGHFEKKDFTSHSQGNSIEID